MKYTIIGRDNVGVKVDSEGPPVRLEAARAFAHSHVVKEDRAPKAGKIHTVDYHAVRLDFDSTDPSLYGTPTHMGYYGVQFPHNPISELNEMITDASLLRQARNRAGAREVYEMLMFMAGLK